MMAESTALEIINPGPEFRQVIGVRFGFALTRKISDSQSALYPIPPSKGFIQQINDGFEADPVSLREGQFAGAGRGIGRPER